MLRGAAMPSMGRFGRCVIAWISGNSTHPSGIYDNVHLSADKQVSASYIVSEHDNLTYRRGSRSSDSDPDPSKSLALHGN